MAKPPPHHRRLKIRIPFFFEAEGEGLWPILCVPVLGLIVILALFIIGARF
jgi:hypothetical protein